MLRPRTISLLAITMLLLTACPPGGNMEGMGEGEGETEGSGEGMGEPEGNGEGSGEGNGEGSGEPEVASLTLRMQADLPDSRRHAIYAFIDDVPHTRETAPFNNAANRLFFRQAEFGTEEDTFNVPVGRWVTVVAFDGGRSQIGVTNGDLAVFNDPGFNEFHTFAGIDNNVLDMGQGVVAFEMNIDRIVTALYRRMPLVVIENSVTGDQSPGQLDVFARFPPFLTFTEEEITVLPNSVQLGPDGAFRAQCRTGSVIEVLAREIDPAPPNAQFVEWLSPACGGDPTCTIFTDESPVQTGALCFWTSGS